MSGIPTNAKIIDKTRAAEIAQKAREEGKIIVFTNGCFDLLHPGHVYLLSKARELGDLLIVGLNSDDSVTRLKGAGKPVLKAEWRAMMLAALTAVDWVVFFNEDTPAALIEAISPHILVIGDDYTTEKVVGKDFVEAHGGKVVIVPLLPGFSSSAILSGDCHKAKKLMGEP